MSTDDRRVTTDSDVPAAPSADPRPTDPPAAELAPDLAAGSARWRAAALALGVLVAAVYVLTHAGRIDIIDGQLRFETLVNLLGSGRPFLDDIALVPHGVRGLEGIPYTGYGFGALLTAWPLLEAALALGPLVGGLGAERARFVFALTGALLGAGAVVVFLVFLRRLGVGLRRAVACGLALAFASLWWPAALSTFDQVQHGFFLLVALLCAWRGALADEKALLLLGGLAGGMLINFAESYALILPFVGIAALAPRDPGEGWRPRLERYVVFGVGCVVGLFLWFAYNEWRFGNPFTSGRGIDLGETDVGAPPHPTFGNPLEGAISLLVSPGKGILFYSPVVVLTLLGWRRFRRRAPWVAGAVAATSAVHFGLIASLAFYGGEWSWGPRYLAPLVPLLALPWAFVSVDTRARRAAVTALVAVSAVVQLGAVAVDHQRFYFARDLAPHFWLEEWVYFERSALLARPGEVVSLLDGPPPGAERFVPAPWPGQVTYAPFGPSLTNEGASEWIRHFSVFWLPRPWPFWMAALEPERRPFDPVVPAAVLALLALLGAAGLAATLKDPGTNPPGTPPEG